MAIKKNLLVEGIDDEHVIKHLSGSRGGYWIDSFVKAGGWPRIVQSMPIHLKLDGSSEDGSIWAIVVDADEDLKSRWESVRDKLVETGYQNVPSDPDPDGTIIDPPKDTLLPRVGIWIMPDNRTNGMLEDFLKFLIPKDSKLFEHVESSVTNIPYEERRFGETVRSKALVHTWLAWQKEPGKPMGTAITSRFFDSDVPKVNRLMAWLNKLYSV